MDFGTTSAGQTAGAMTFEAWINLSSYQTEWNVIAARQNGSGSILTARDWQFSVYKNGTYNNVLRLDTYSGSEGTQSTAYGSSTIPLNGWVLVGFTLTSGGTPPSSTSTVSPMPPPVLRPARMAVIRLTSPWQETTEPAVAAST